MINTSKYILKEGVSWNTMKLLTKAYPDILVLWGVNTCYWTIDYPKYKTKEGLPCGPRGEMLQQGELTSFIKCAEDNPAFYEKHGLRTFMAGLHGNVLSLTDKGNLPTSFEHWRDYNVLIDAKILENRNN